MGEENKKKISGINSEKTDNSKKNEKTPDMYKEYYLSLIHI